MRTVILICLFVASIYVANAQLSIENSRTEVTFNKEASFSPLEGTFSPQSAIRFEYALKKGHGPFLGLATSRSIVKYNFSNPETGMTDYTASRGNAQLRFEGGY